MSPSFYSYDGSATTSVTKGVQGRRPAGHPVSLLPTFPAWTPRATLWRRERNTATRRDNPVAARWRSIYSLADVARSIGRRRDRGRAGAFEDRAPRLGSLAAGQARRRGGVGARSDVGRRAVHSEV